LPKFTELFEACAWCLKQLGKKDCVEYEADEMKTTHGICPACYQKELEKLDAEMPNEYGERGTK